MHRYCKLNEEHILLGARDRKVVILRPKLRYQFKGSTPRPDLQDLYRGLWFPDSDQFIEAVKVVYDSEGPFAKMI